MFPNDFMCSSQVLWDATFSKFNVALLRDSGWYAEVDETMADPMIWGKNLGCDFLYGECNTLAASFDEFVAIDAPE